MTLVDCDLAGGADYLGSVFPALRVLASTVVAIDSTFRGIDGGMLTALSVSNASSGIGMTASDLTLIRCTATGGSGANPTFCLGGVGGGHGAAAVAGGDVLRALGATVLTGGSGGTGGLGCPNGSSGAAATATTVRLGPTVVVNGVIGPTTPAVDAVDLDGPANPMLGTTATLLVTTQPGDFVVLALAPAPASFTAVPGNDLPFVLPTTGMLVFGGQVAGSSGPVTFAVPIPNLLQLAQQLLLAQGASLGPTVRLTSPHYARIR